jgi:hypothetical protein
MPVEAVTTRVLGRRKTENQGAGVWCSVELFGVCSRCALTGGAASSGTGENAPLTDAPARCC